MHWLSHSNNWCGPGFFFNGPLGMIFSFLFLGLVVLLGVKLVHVLWPEKSGKGSSCMDVLQRRYANGEVDEETYLKMKQKLH